MTHPAQGSAVIIRNDEDALTNELAWASSRSGSLWDSEASGKDCPALTDPEPFVSCLTGWETQSYMGYTDKFPNTVYSLTQSPSGRPTYAKGEERFCTKKFCLPIEP